MPESLVLKEPINKLIKDLEVFWVYHSMRKWVHYVSGWCNEMCQMECSTTTETSKKCPRIVLETLNIRTIEWEVSTFWLRYSYFISSVCIRIPWHHFYTHVLVLQLHKSPQLYITMLSPKIWSSYTKALDLGEPSNIHWMRLSFQKGKFGAAICL